MEKVITSLTVLLTGFVVVFLVLFLLIGIIIVYGKIISGAEAKARQIKENKENVKNKELPPDVRQEAGHAAVGTASALPFGNDALPQETVAVIAAAVEASCGAGASARIKSMKKAPSSRSAWGNAGVLQNTRPF